MQDSNVAAAQAVANIVDHQVKPGKYPVEAIAQTRDLISNAYAQGLENTRVNGLIPDSFLNFRKNIIPNDHPMLPKNELTKWGTIWVG